MKRAGIYFFYDQDGIVDRYVLYAIRELRKVIDYVVVVVNGVLQPECRKELASVADDMFVRENKGFDAWAYKDGIDYIGLDELREYDELVFMNFTLFGPIYPLRELFDRMEADPCDFWGLYMSYENLNTRRWGPIVLKWNYKPDALATCFLVFRANVLHSTEFARHWSTLPRIRNYYESGVYNEMQLTQMLRDSGFTMSVVCPDSFRSDYRNPTVDGALEAVVDHRLPLFRRKAFFDQNGSLDCAANIPRKLLHYINEETDYDVDMIWENLLRTTNLFDLKNWLNLNAILPLKASSKEQNSDKLAVIFHVRSPEYTVRCLKYLEAFPVGTDFYLSTSAETELPLKALLEEFSKTRRVEFRITEGEEEEMSALLTLFGDLVPESDYDLICFMHDRMMNEENAVEKSVERAFSEACFENVAANEDYIRNIVELFRRQPRMGVALPPPPRNAQYYRLIGGSWYGDFRCVSKLLEDLEIHVPLVSGKPPTAPYGRIFWFRPAALAPLFRRAWRPEDFDDQMPGDYGNAASTVTTASVFAAQSAGFYPMVVMNSDYAEQELTVMTDIAHTYVGMTLKYVRAKSSMKAATRSFQQYGDSVAREKKSPSKGTKKGLKGFLRGLCPIGIWNLLRRLRCRMKGEEYVEPEVPRGMVKTIARACVPRFLWEYLRDRR